MQVVAVKPAFYDGRRVRVGDALEVPDEFKGAWFVKAEAVKPPAKLPKPPKPEPKALSQMGKGESETFIQAHEKTSDLA